MIRLKSTAQQAQQVFSAFIIIMFIPFAAPDAAGIADAPGGLTACGDQSIIGYEAHNPLESVGPIGFYKDISGGGGLFADSEFSAKAHFEVGEDGCIRAGGSASTPADPPSNPNRSPAKPTLTGPSSGVEGVQYSFSATSTDPEGDLIRYRFEWGDGQQMTTGLVTSGTTISRSHSWGGTGTYNVRVLAIDQHGSQSARSDPRSIAITENSPPGRPIISGPSSGETGDSISFSATAVDPDGHQIRYQFQWDDGTTVWTGFTASGNSRSASHAWTSSGDGNVRVRAEDSIGAKGPWSSFHFIEIRNPGGAPDTPEINGRDIAIVDIQSSFEAISKDPEGGSIRLLWDWGDGTTTQNTWHPDNPNQLRASHTWDDTGTYSVRVQAENEQGIFSPWSQYFQVLVTEVPPEPPTITGPDQVRTGASWRYTFQSGDGYADEFRIHIQWGTGAEETTDWMKPFETYTTTYQWKNSGTHTLQARVEDARNLFSEWENLDLNVLSRPPTQPMIPVGPDNGIPHIEYNFTTHSKDADGDEIRYQFDWGNDEVTTTGFFSSGENVSASSTWDDSGFYHIRVRAQDVNGEWSTWSGTKNVTIDWPDLAHFIPIDQREATCRQLENFQLGDPGLSCDRFVDPPFFTSSWLNSFESTLIDGVPGPEAMNHDWDGDGVIDLFDSVNLPSETRFTVSDVDRISLLQGIEPTGFLLLVEPSHRIAYLVVAWPDQIPDETWNSTATLDLVEELHGVEVRNALARVINHEIMVHVQFSLPNTPLLNQSLPAPLHGLAADGTWLLMRTDATRHVDLFLGGKIADVASPLASHPTGIGTNFRWEFVNPHHGTSFCYDAATVTGASTCTGTADPGWLRTYSGQAAYSLRSLEQALSQGFIPFGPESLLGLISSNLENDDIPGGNENSTNHLFTTYRVPKSSNIYSVYDGDSSWSILGNQSKRFPHGVGVNYLFGLEGLSPGQPFVSQVESFEKPSAPVLLRQFHFEGSHIRTPGQPQDLNHISLGVESADGNPNGQTFRLGGRALASLLDLDGQSPIVEIDESHETGFEYRMVDTDGDGYDDLVFHVPHFSQAWVTVRSPMSPRATVVEVAGQDSAWIGTRNGIYEYKVDANGNAFLEHHPIDQDISAWISGLHLLGPNEFYVSGHMWGKPGCDYGGLFVGYFNDGWQSFDWIGTGCNTGGFISDIWVNPELTHGYVSGTGVVLHEFYGVNWWPSTVGSRPDGCLIRSIELDNSGEGYMGGNCWRMGRNEGAIWRLQNYALNRQSAASETVEDLMGPTGEWGVGMPYRSWTNGVGILYQTGSSWGRVLDEPGNPNPARYFAVERMPDSDTVWFIGGNIWANNPNIVKNKDGEWEDDTFTIDFSASGSLEDVSFLDSRFGLAVGATVMVFQGNEPPEGIEDVTLGPTDVSTQELVTGDATSVFDPDGDDLKYEWNWGDGSSSSDTVTATHRYNDVGTYYVTLIVDDRYDKVTRTWKVTTSPEDLILSGSETITISGNTKQRHHYRVVDSVGEAVEAKLISCTEGVRLLGRVGFPVSKEMEVTQWPDNPQSGTRIAGTVPAGKTLYLAVEKPAEVNSASCTLTTKSVDPPSTPVIERLPEVAPSTDHVEIRVRANHPDGFDTQVLVNWGDGTSSQSPSNRFGFHDSVRALEHNYARGTYVVRVQSMDEAGQTSDTASRGILIRDPAVAEAEPAEFGDNNARLQGTVTDRGGANAVLARYKVYEGTSTSGEPFDVSGWFTVTSGVNTWIATGLTAGQDYSYVVEVDNGAYLSESEPSKFQTMSTTDTKPEFVTAPTTVTTGSSASFMFGASGVESQDVRYHVRWGDGTSWVSGWISPTGTITKSHTFVFPHGSTQATLQLETTSGSRSETVATPLTVTGSSPVIGIEFDPQLNSAGLTGTIGNNVIFDGSTEARITYRDPLKNSWISSVWTSVSDDSVVTWTPTGLDVSRTYAALMDFRTASGASWRTTESWEFAANNAPTLVPLQIVDRVKTYMDMIRFSVLYQDEEGDPPEGGVTMILDGKEYDMHPPVGSLNHRSGVEYHYVFPSEELGAPGTYIPRFIAEDRFQIATTTGGSMTLRQSHVTWETFEGDTPGHIPSGFVKEQEPLNYWHVTDTDQQGFPNLAALGRHGNAIWFGRTPGATYNDPDGGVPKGTLDTLPYDLSTIGSPVLSFASYYETENLGSEVDKKQVLIRTKQPYSDLWNGWEILHVVEGYEGGYNKWRTQAVDLSDYEGLTIQLRFLFDAVDNLRNNHLGWLVDDIIIGHDHDGDTLLDAVEMNRLDIHVAEQMIPVFLPDEGEANMHVRRAARPLATEFILEGIVSHPDPSTLKVWVGVAPSLIEPNPPSTLIYDGGIVGDCKAPGGLPGITTFTRDTVETRSDGLRIALDLFDCGFPSEEWDRYYDWYLEVEDTSLDGKTGVIEALRIWSAGKTDPEEADTNHDGVSDGERVLAPWHDPLGRNMMGTGVHQSMDSNDGNPRWMPAAVVSSTNYTDYIDFEFVDLVAPLSVVFFSRENTGGEDWRSLSRENHGGEKWRVQMEGAMPDRVNAVWLDEHGTEGRTTLWMGISDAGHYQPQQLRGEFTPVDGEVQHWTHELDGEMVFGFMVTFGSTVTRTAPNPWVKLGGAIKAAVGAAGLLALGAGTVTIMEYASLDSPSHRTINQPTFGEGVAFASISNLCFSHGINLALSQALQDQATSKGFASASQMRQAVGNVCSPVADFDANTHRWFWPGLGGLVVFIIDDSNTVVDGWVWEFPGINYREWDFRMFYELEKRIAERLVDGTKDIFKHIYVTRSSRPSEPPDHMALHSWGDDMPTRVDETALAGEPWILPPGTVKGIKQRYNEIKRGLISEITEAALGEASFGVMHAYAKDDQFHDKGEPRLLWYWYDDDPSLLCENNPDIRKCHEFTIIDSVFEKETWSNIGKGVDRLETRDVDWTSGHADTLAAKGVVNREQLAELDSGVEPHIGVLRKMSESSARGQPGVDADVGISYDFLNHKSLHITVDYRGTQ